MIKMMLIVMVMLVFFGGCNDEADHEADGDDDDNADCTHEAGDGDASRTKFECHNLAFRINK